MRAVTSWSTPRGSVHVGLTTSGPSGSRRTDSGRNPSATRRPTSCSTPGRRAWASRRPARRRVRPIRTAGAPSTVVTRGGDDVHRRRADELRDEQVDRMLVQLDRRAALHDPAVAHHRRPVAHRHRLDLIVRDVERRDPHELVEGDDLEPHLGAQLGIEVRHRLVHQQHARRAHDRPAHRRPLLLTARELSGDSGRAARSAGAAARSRRPCSSI